MIIMQVDRLIAKHVYTNVFILKANRYLILGQYVEFPTLAPQ